MQCRLDVDIASISLSHKRYHEKVQNNAPEHKIRKSPTTPLTSHNQKGKAVIPLRRNLWELGTICFVHLAPQTRYTGISTRLKTPTREAKEMCGSIPVNTNCPTAAANPAKKELKGYPPVKHAYTNCTAPTYTRKTRKASIRSSELGVFARYDFQSSVVALERPESDKESWFDEWVECVDGGFEGVEEMVEGTSGLVFFGGMVGDRGSLEFGEIFTWSDLGHDQDTSAGRLQQKEYVSSFIANRVLVKRKLA
jgi:hypothetical protein